MPNSPPFEIEPGDMVARVFWVETAEGKGLAVQCADAADLGAAAMVICKSIVEMNEFSPDCRRAAARMLFALGLSQKEQDEKPTHVVRNIKRD